MGDASTRARRTNPDATDGDADWNPRDPAVVADPLSAYDRMRRRCPVAHSDYLDWSVFRHADVMRALSDPDTFSSHTSRRVAVPHSMDPPEHAAYRAIIDPYFSPERMAEFRPACRRLCAERVAALPTDEPVEIMAALAYPFALRVQCAFLGWPDTVHEPLRQWLHKKNAAVTAGNREAIAAVATEFDRTIRELLAVRRGAGAAAPDDATTRLMRETLHGRALTDTEIVSILRNWTVGELGTLAASVGIIVVYLAHRPELQERLRRHPERIVAANDEILRIHPPLIANRRRTTCPVHMGGRMIERGERLTLLWASANRDEAVFGDPDAFRPDRDPGLNLLYGAGIHACPGARLARLELEAVVRALLRATRALEPAGGESPAPAAYPAGGYRHAHVVLRRHENAG